MSVTGVHGQPLEINVVGCRNLKDTEWISRQDPYVVIEYANNKFRTKTDTDGGKNPSFNQKFTVSLIEGLRELNVQVWNSNTITFDDLIGTGRVQIEKALSTGYDDNAWPLTSRHGKYAGELRLILHYANARNSNPAAYAYQGPSPSAPYPAYPPPAPYSSPYSQAQAPGTGYPPPGPSSAYQQAVGVPPYAGPPLGPYATPNMSYPPPVGPSMPYAAPNTAYASPAPSYPPSYYPPAPSPVYGPPPGAYPPIPFSGYGYPGYEHHKHGKHKHKGHKFKGWKYGKK